MDELWTPLDREGFSLRECPRCDARFKIRWSAREAAVVAASFARRVTEMDAGEAEPAPTRHCPYCACEAPADAFLTSDVREQLDAQARRFEEEVRWRRLRLPLEWLGDNPRVTYVPVAPAPPSLLLRPDHADDLLRIALPCCGAEQKVTDAWLGPIRCHRCGVAHLRAGPRDIGLELALLRQWVGAGPDSEP
jgi:hypothetical protein